MMSVPRFESFVLLAGMRTGSNYLEANLNALPGVVCHGEVFNPHFIGRLGQTETMGIDLAQRDADPVRLLLRLRERTEGLAGFRYFHDHDPRILPLVLADPACAKIVLTRNPVESYVSWKIAQATGQWKLTRAQKARTAEARFDAAEFETHLDNAQRFQIDLLHALQIGGQTAFYLDYEDISDVSVLNGLALFLGVEARLAGLDGALKKQNPEPLEEKVANPAEMAAALSRLDRFNLARTPNFEPRRPVAIPSFAAAGRILHMPIRGGPEARMEGWLATLGPVTTAFTQKSLRQWMKDTGTHRGVVVLRHPLVRAHAVFAEGVLTGRLPNVRELLIRSWKIALPDAGEDALGPDEHRAAFLAFLAFCKRSTAGQSGQRVDPHVASQSAAIQGFAQLRPPDHLLREDRLEAGLAAILADLGLSHPGPADVVAPHLTRLAAIHDPVVEAAAREAYGRDYIHFGFGAWAPGP